MVVLICLAAILPIASINRLFTEETHGRMNQLFATKFLGTNFVGQIYY